MAEIDAADSGTVRFGVGGRKGALKLMDRKMEDEVAGVENYGQSDTGGN